VDTKDLSKFDIVPEKVSSGEDARTTVMVRNIPKNCSREGFVELLTLCGCDNYSFFYMPFDKRRAVHCGFAFVDFASPRDVLTLHQCMQSSPVWRQALGGSGGGPHTAPALSYARLQGQDQLMKHFSLSAVMHDSDARKRPVFLGDGPGQARGAAGAAERVPDARHRGAPAKVDLEALSMQPRYVSIAGPDALEPKDAPTLGRIGAYSCDTTLLGG